MSVGVLLAGGRSVRMGRDKTAIEIDGETLVERHLRQLKDAGVAGAIVVCNSANEEAIRHRIGARTVLQNGEGMSAAVLTGIEAAGAVSSAWFICVNDIVAADDYRALAAAEGDIVIPTCTLDRTFHGGRLEIAGRAVRAIVEKPPGGCPPGSAANIMVHRWTNWLPQLRELLAAGTDYESAVNRVIAAGARATPVAVRSWIALKTPEDLVRSGWPAATRP